MKNQEWLERYLENLEDLKITESIVVNTNVNAEFFTSDELKALGITCGDRCLVHKTCIIVNPSKLTLGNDVRIDGFCTISCGNGIKIGSYVHIAGYVSLFGGAEIEIMDYASIASGSKIYSVSDDLMGRGFVGPCVDMSLRHLHKGKVILEEHSVLAVNTVVMPKSTLRYGSVLLPFSLLLGDTEKMSIYSGNLAKKTKDRLDTFLQKKL